MATTLTPSPPRPPTRTRHTPAPVGSPPDAPTGRRHIARAACHGARHGGPKFGKKNGRDASGWVTTGSGGGGQGGGKAPRTLQGAMAPSLGPRVRRRRPRRPTAANVATVGDTDRAASVCGRARGHDRPTERCAWADPPPALPPMGAGVRTSFLALRATPGGLGGGAESHIRTRPPPPAQNRPRRGFSPDHEGGLTFEPIAPLRQRSAAVRHLAGARITFFGLLHVAGVLSIFRKNCFVRCAASCAFRVTFLSWAQALVRVFVPCGAVRRRLRRQQSPRE